MYRSIFHRTLDTTETEDIISVVYMKAIKHIRTFHGTTEGEFFSWILRVAYTTYIDSTRGETHESLEDSLIDPGYSLDHAHDIDTREKLSEVLDFLDTLTERDRAIITLRIWDELSYEEITHITGESVSNAKKIVSRSLQKIAANVQYIFLFSILLTYVIRN